MQCSEEGRSDTHEQMERDGNMERGKDEERRQDTGDDWGCRGEKA